MHPTPTAHELHARRRFLRRLRGERGSLYLEFALMAPLALAVAGFVVDFAHLTLVRQQLDVCARFAADVESRSAIAYGDRTPKLPGGVRNTLVGYLAHATAHPLAKRPAGRDEVHLRYRQKPLPLQCVGAFLTGRGDALVGKADGKAAVAVGLFSSILKAALDLVSFRNVRYLTEPFAEDYTVGASVSARTETLFPSALYEGLGGGIGWEGGRAFLVLPESPDGADGVSRRYCYMPNRETLPKRPPTYTRTVGNLIAKIKKTFGVK